jgi:hypothetical protein
MADGRAVYTVADFVTLWVAEDRGSVHIKTREPHGDPVELSEGEAIELFKILKKLIKEIQ